MSVPLNAKVAAVQSDVVLSSCCYFLASLSDLGITVLSIVLAATGVNRVKYTLIERAMSMTLVEKILAKKAGKEVVRPDELVEVSVDRAMIHDA